MSTQTPGKTVRLRSPHAEYWLSIRTNQDSYNEFGGMRLVKAGSRIRFHRGIAEIPPSMVEEVKASRFYGVDFWLEDDLRRPLEEAGGGPRVASGQVHGSSRRAPEAEPLAGWNETAPRELRKRIQAGEVADPQAALLYEAERRRRSSVMTALGELIGEDDEDSAEPEVAPIAPVPEHAKVD